MTKMIMADLEDFTPDEQNTLRSGKVIITKMPGKEQCFVQLLFPRQ